MATGKTMFPARLVAWTSRLSSSASPEYAKRTS
ncbi:uncharacterized protein METZ01_LOCUS70186 [marine metagenome]|uniref:Uncharacterized protein n=1 Tax=marine metagenome TaxID=408172 RepID=A0A381TMP3_9ZZZZ